MTPIQITCLGHGGAFAHPDVGHTAYLVQYADRRILVDCGSTVPDVLKEFGIDPGSLTDILLTHLHADHVGGLERILYHRHYVSKVGPVRVIAIPEVMSALLTWIGVVRNDLLRHFTPVIASVGNDTQIGPAVTVTALKVNHGGDIPDMACSCFTLLLDGTAVFFSGDRIWQHAGHTRVRDEIRHADLVFHEIELFQPPSGAHTNVSDLADEVFGENVWWGHHGSGARQAVADMRLKLTQKGDVWVINNQEVTHIPKSTPAQIEA